MAKQCVLDEDKICDECGECERCDLDPTKLCDNCGRCINGCAEAEFRSMMIKRPSEPAKDDSNYITDDGIDEFLDEPIDLETSEEIPVDTDLLAQWENILNESFRNDSKSPSDDDEPVLRAVRKRRTRDAKHFPVWEKRKQ